MGSLKNISGVFALFCLTTCHTQGEFTNKQTKSNLNTGNDLLEVNALAYHENDSVTSIFVEIRNENLLYKFPDTSAYPYAELKIYYKLVNTNNPKQLVDSGSVHLRDRLEGEALSAKSIFTQFKINASLGSAYLLTLETIDLNKKIQYGMQTEVIKLNRRGRQNFLVRQNGLVSHKTNFIKNESIHITLNAKGKKWAYVDCFFKEIPLAPPPHSTKVAVDLNFKPDSGFRVPVQNNELDLVMPENGFYHLRLDSNNNEGLSLFTFDKSFPGVSNNDEMINCTRYLMTKEEYNSCLEAANKKEAIDKFWLEIGGSNERAKELLRKYYTRVKEANKYYSALNQGWKSDRGMIYIVFGEASSVVRRTDEEIWIYGSALNQTTLTFVFKKILNPYSDNLYVLERSQFYKPAWSNAVDQWRQGIYYEGRR